MIYKVPDTDNKEEKQKFLVDKGQYLCNNCNKPQNIKKYKDYLQPCRFCGCETFWSL